MLPTSGRHLPAGLCWVTSPVMLVGIKTQASPQKNNIKRGKWKEAKSSFSLFLFHFMWEIPKAGGCGTSLCQEGHGLTQHSSVTSLCQKRQGLTQHSSVTSRCQEGCCSATMRPHNSKGLQQWLRHLERAGNWGEA